MKKLAGHIRDYIAGRCSPDEVFQVETIGRLVDGDFSGSMSYGEVMKHGENALLVDFHDHNALAAQVIEVLARPEAFSQLGQAARAHMIANYDFATKCLPTHIARINSLVPKGRAIPLR